MPKKISERQRLLTYAMTASEEQLTEGLELFRTALAARYSKTQTRAAKGRKAAPKPAKLAQPELPNVLAADEERDEPAPAKRGKQSDKFQPDPTVMKMIDESKQENGQAATA